MIQEAKPNLPAEGTPAPVVEKKKHARILGLDTLRFILAGWVVLGHFRLTPFPLAFIGVSAVMAFFVVSGFCIHLPFYRGKPLLLKSYFVRREIRIVIPVVAAVGIGWLVNDFHFTGVFWSLICEEVYYLLYPSMLAYRRKVGSWKPHLIVSFILAAVIVLYFGSNGGKNDFHGLGPYYTWAIGLPVWLMGCVLAEKCDHLTAWDGSKLGIWAWRFGVWAAAAFCGLFRSHPVMGLPVISYRYTLPFYSIFVFYWIWAELRYAVKYPPKPYLESLGMASYTMYLTHMLVFPILHMDRNRSGSDIRVWATAMVGVAILTPLFYFLIEKPSHRLARMAGDRLDGKKPVTA